MIRLWCYWSIVVGGIVSSDIFSRSARTGRFVAIRTQSWSYTGDVELSINSGSASLPWLKAIRCFLLSARKLPYAVCVWRERLWHVLKYRWLRVGLILPTEWASLHVKNSLAIGVWHVGEVAHDDMSLPDTR